VLDFAEENSIGRKLAARPKSWKIASLARISHWRGMALVRMREQTPAATQPRVSANRNEQQQDSSVPAVSKTGGMAEGAAPGARVAVRY
jgi:hypothetical protein